MVHWPAYTCPRCAQVHRDIRPGRLGLFTRRCECGARLPRAGVAGCPAPECRLPALPGIRYRRTRVPSRDVRIPSFGDRSAGKTRFLYAALNSLMQSAEQEGVTISFPDPEAEYQVARGLEAIRSGQDCPGHPRLRWR